MFYFKMILIFFPSARGENFFILGAAKDAPLVFSLSLNMMV